ncbi:MAG: hypothetical protein EU536_04805 [Promethearchaeota archaeon]|nr:MAG: hypothetical protein EU536_04805 [Candidatus Lokiarchaeota archaeon]
MDRLNQIAKNENLDRSSLVRKFVLQQIKEYNLRDVGEKYRKGLISLAEAATLAKVSIYDMMEYIEREKIYPPPPSPNEIEERIEESKKIFNKI